jgi:hypothetical protein
MVGEKVRVVISLGPDERMTPKFPSLAGFNIIL